jgi:hypothetical protein
MSAVISPEIRAMAERLGPPVAQQDTAGETTARSALTADPRAELRRSIAAECPSAEDAGNITEALLVAGHDLFTAVYETILVCAAAETGPGVAAAAARRAFFLRGTAPRYLIDAAVLEAAAELAERQRQSTTTSAAVVTPESPGQTQQRALEKERLRRMMEKGLIGDEYRDYVDDRRALAEAMTPPAAPLPTGMRTYTTTCLPLAWWAAAAMTTGWTSPKTRAARPAPGKRTVCYQISIDAYNHTERNTDERSTIPHRRGDALRHPGTHTVRGPAGRHRV